MSSSSLHQASLTGYFLCTLRAPWHTNNRIVQDAWWPQSLSCLSCIEARNTEDRQRRVRDGLLASKYRARTDPLTPRVGGHWVKGQSLTIGRVFQQGKED